MEQWEVRCVVLSALNSLQNSLFTEYFRDSLPRLEAFAIPICLIKSQEWFSGTSLTLESFVDDKSDVVRSFWRSSFHGCYKWIESRVPWCTFNANSTNLMAQLSGTRPLISFFVFTSLCYLKSGKRNQRIKLVLSCFRFGYCFIKKASKLLRIFITDREKEKVQSNEAIRKMNEHPMSVSIKMTIFPHITNMQHWKRPINR